jgi:hypothetical protein
MGMLWMRKTQHFMLAGGAVSNAPEEDPEST